MARFRLPDGEEMIVKMGMGEGQRSFISNRSFSLQYPLEA